jgi:hypothetical protein
VLPGESDPYSRQSAKFELAAPKDDATIPFLPHIAEEDDQDSKLKDWSISQLYLYTIEAHTRYLLDKSIVNLYKGQKRPETPENQKKLNESERTL